MSRNFVRSFIVVCSCLLVVLLAVPLVPHELGVHPLGARVPMLLRLLDAVSMVLVGLVVSGMVL